MQTKLPTKIELKLSSNTLELSYEGNEHYSLSAEFLRVHSPSAEVRGHGKPVLQYGKIAVRLIKIEAAGNYALKLSFDDGHDSGLYNWEYLYALSQNKSSMWDSYLEALKNKGLSRDATY